MVAVYVPNAYIHIHNKIPVGRAGTCHNALFKSSNVPKYVLTYCILCLQRGIKIIPMQHK